MTSDFGPGEEYALVIALPKAHDHGNTSCVYCLKLRGFDNKERFHAKGEPFRLLDNKWMFIWKNDSLRELGIDFGSIIIVDQLRKLVGNTGQKMVSFVYV